MFYSGLGIARDLAEHGVHVLGISSDRDAYGNHTRLCEVRIAPDSQNDPEKLLEFLLDLTAEMPGALIFPTRDADVMFLDHFRSELRHYYHLVVPTHDCLRKVMDKYSLVREAAAAGIAVPRTMAVHREGDLARVAAEVGFPCVVKPISAVEWRAGKSWEIVGKRKAFCVADEAELRREYAGVVLVTPAVLIQELVPGPADELVIVGGYVGDDSEPLACFTARKLIQSPDDFGTGCVVQSESIPGLLEITKRLWKALRYQGMAEVEYKRDRRTGEFKLIEINTRHWDQHRLARVSGINLSWVAYAHVTGRGIEPDYRPTHSGKWIAEDALLLHALHSVRRRQLSMRRLARALAGPRTYGVFSWQDPAPFLWCFGRLIRTILGAVLKGFRRKGGES